MKRTLKRLICMLLTTVMCVTMLPVDVFAWKNLSHANSANITWLNLLSYADTSDYDLEIFAPYDDHTADGTYTYKIPEEFRQAIIKYPDAFRAGSLGPDFYPDIVIGQAYIHPYDTDAEVGSGEWLSRLVQSLNQMPQYSEGRLEGLAFTLGFMLHYCGDMFGHDFVNTFSGGTFPNLADIDITDPKGVELNNVLSHMSIESYMDDKVNDDFWDGGALDVDAPTKFITDTLVLNNNVSSGVAGIYYAFEEGTEDSVLGGIPVYIDLLVELRIQVMAYADALRPSTEPITMGLSSYADQWALDIDRALYGLVDTFDMIAQRLMTGEKNPEIKEETLFEWIKDGYPIEEMLKNLLDLDEIKDDGGTIDIILEELSLWLNKYGIKALGVPDILVDGFPEWVSYIFWPISLPIDIVVARIKELFSFIFAEIIVAAVGPTVKVVKGAAAALEGRLENPKMQLDHEQNPYRPSENNFAELKEYIDRYAAEQRLLNGQDPVTLITNSDGTGVLAQLTDSEFEAFYNTMTMFKLILMGPQNFSAFIKEKTGITQRAYTENTGLLEATSLKIDVTTYDTKYGGTDDNVYLIIYAYDDQGVKREIGRKLFDNSLKNDLEIGNTDTYYADLKKAVRIDRLEFSVEQKGTPTANGGWKCENIVITPMHAGVALTDPIGVGGNLYMDAGRIWDLDFQTALRVRNRTINNNTPVTHVEVRIKTGNGDYFDGTDKDVYIGAADTTNSSFSEKVILDKYKNLYNDFEDGDDDVYFVPLAEYDKNTHKTTHATLGSLALVLLHDSDYDWIVKNLTLTPYYGSMALTEPIDFGGMTFDSSSDFMLITPSLEISDGNVTFKEYPEIDLSYRTALDDGLLAGMLSLDSSMQWEYLPVLWGSAEGQRLFFELFKGFRPEIEIDVPDMVYENDPFNLKVSLTGVWNGVGEERRNAVNYTPEMPHADVPKVLGTVTVSATKPAGAGSYNEYILAKDAPIRNNEVFIDTNYANTLEAGTYHLKVSYTADANDPMFGDTQVVFTGALNVTKKAEFTVTALPNNSAYGWVSGSGSYPIRSKVVLTAYPNDGYQFKGWKLPSGQIVPGTLVTEEDSSGARPSTSTRPSTGTRPSTTTRPSTVTRPSTTTRPSTGTTPSTSTRPSTGTRPSTSTRPSIGTRPSTTTRPFTGVQSSTGYTYEIPQLIANVSLVAVFEPMEYEISVGSSTSGCRATGSGTYKFGDSVTITAQAKTGFLFTGWYENGEMISNSSIYIFKADADRDITARFTRFRGVTMPSGTSLTGTSGTGYRIVVDEDNDPVRSLIDRIQVDIPERLLDDLRRGNDALKPIVDDGGNFSFAVVIEDGYGKSDDFAVKANGTVLTEKNGKYTVTGVTGDLKITVEGVIKLEPTPKPVISYTESDTAITFTATGEGEVILYVNGRPVSNPYTHVLTDKAEAIAVYATAQGKDKLISEPAALTDNESGSNVLVPVIIGDFAHGKVAVDNKYDAPGTETTLTVTPDAGYALRELTVVSDGVSLALKQIDGKYQFTRPSEAAVVTAVFEPAISYVDVQESDWFYDDVQYVSIAGLMNGTGSGMFSPDVMTTRAMLVTVLWRLEGSPNVSGAIDFDDVPDGQWYSGAVDWASANGIVNGYGDGRFGPEDLLTREQIAAILNRYAVLKKWAQNETLPGLSKYNCSDWAKSNVSWAGKNGILDGLGVDVTNMTADASRAELAAYLHRFMTNVKK